MVRLKLFQSASRVNIKTIKTNCITLERWLMSSELNITSGLLDIDDLLDFLPQMVRLLDEPIADPDCGAVYYVSKLARENDVTVCQLGEGSDELFLGYPKWKQCLTLQYLSSDHFPWAWPKQLAVSMLRLHPKLHNTNQLEWLRRASLNQPIFWGGAEAFSELEKKKATSLAATQAILEVFVL